MAEPSALPGASHREPASVPLLRTMLGDVLRRTRLGQGRTLADVARHARVSMPYLSEVERGRKEASSEVLAAICDALQIGLADLLAMIGSDLAGHASPHEVLRPLELPRRLGEDAPGGPAGLDRSRDAQALLGLAGWPSAGDALCRLAA